MIARCNTCGTLVHPVLDEIGPGGWECDDCLDYHGSDQ